MEEKLHKYSIIDIKHQKHCIIDVKQQKHCIIDVKLQKQYNWCKTTKILYIDVKH